MRARTRFGIGHREGRMCLQAADPVEGIGLRDGGLDREPLVEDEGLRAVGLREGGRGRPRARRPGSATGSRGRRAGRSWSSARRSCSAASSVAGDGIAEREEVEGGVAQGAPAGGRGLRTERRPGGLGQGVAKADEAAAPGVGRSGGAGPCGRDGWRRDRSRCRSRWRRRPRSAGSSTRAAKAGSRRASASRKAPRASTKAVVVLRDVDSAGPARS